MVTEEIMQAATRERVQEAALIYRENEARALVEKDPHLLRRASSTRSLRIPRPSVSLGWVWSLRAAFKRA